MKNKGGRPKSYNKEQVKEICKKYENYIEVTDVPIVAEFAYQNNITRGLLYEYPEFLTLTKRAIEKKEAQLEKLALFNVVNSTMAIFSLKQLGWSDKQQVEVSGGDTPVGVKLHEAIKKAKDDFNNKRDS